MYGKPANIQNHSDSARQAFDLWMACNKERQNRILNFAQVRFARAKVEAKNDTIPKPKKYPVTFDEFLRLMMGDKTRKERVEIFKEYVRELIRRGRVSALADPLNKVRIYKEEAEKLVGDGSDIARHGSSRRRQRQAVAAFVGREASRSRGIAPKRAWLRRGQKPGAHH